MLMCGESFLMKFRLLFSTIEVLRTTHSGLSKLINYLSIQHLDLKFNFQHKCERKPKVEVSDRFVSWTLLGGRVQRQQQVLPSSDEADVQPREVNADGESCFSLALEPEKSSLFPHFFLCKQKLSFSLVRNVCIYFEVCFFGLT